MMKKYISGIVFIPFVFGVAFAGHNNHERMTEKLLIQIKVGKSIRDALDKQLYLQLQNEESLVKYRPIIRGYLEKYMGWEGLKEEYIKAYSPVFTDNELEESIQYFNTSAGAKFLEYNDKLKEQVAGIGVKRVREHLQELEDMIKEEAAKKNKK